jgi:DNA-binding response OmpR family regulator
MAETVLVVDNDEQTLSALSCALGAAGYTPLLAQNGVAALAHAVSQSPMFTLLAMELADMDSLALGRALRARLPETLILMLVGPNVQERIIAALRLGIVDFLTRPVDPAELTSVLARLRQQCELQQRFARVESYIASSSVTPLAEHDQRKLIEALRDTAITINSTLNLDQISGTYPGQCGARCSLRRGQYHAVERRDDRSAHCARARLRSHCRPVRGASDADFL